MSSSFSIRTDRYCSYFSLSPLESCDLDSISLFLLMFPFLFPVFWYDLFLQPPGFLKGIKQCHIWTFCDVRRLDTQMCSEWHAVSFLSVRADSASHSDSALVLQLALRRTLPQMPGVEAEHWTPPPPRLVYLSSHNALGNRRQAGGGEWRWGCVEEQQQGSFSQMDVFTLGCFLISHCNEKNT